MKQQTFDLDTPIFQLSPAVGSESYSVRDSIQHCLVVGSTGSGKSSASFRRISTGYLKAGYGGIILTCKPDELKTWQHYCAETGRADDLIVVEPGRKNHFNFLEYISSSATETSYAENIFQVLKTVITAGESRKSNGEKDAFWEQAIDQLILNTIDLCLLAYNKVTVQLLYDVARTAPKKIEGSRQPNKEIITFETPYQTAVSLAKKNVKVIIDDWLDKQDEWQLKGKTEGEYEEYLTSEVAEYRTVKMINDFFTQSLYDIPEKTRSLVNFSFTNFLYRLLREPVYSLLCRHRSTFTPEDCLSGKIIIINLPVKTYHKVGQDIQILMKYIFQRSWEKRNIEENERPLFIIADEAHNFLHPLDCEFQSSARSSRVGVLYVTQNLSNIHMSFGENSEHKVKSLLGNFSTKIFHANADIGTNEYAESLIGQAYTEDVSRTTQMSQDFSMSNSTSYKLEHMVRASEFSTLKTGGPKNNFQVTAYIHMQGKKLATGFCHQKICFNQNSKI